MVKALEFYVEDVSAPRSGADTRERILSAAEKLFAKNGFNPTSVRAITAEAGVNLAAIHYYFGGKENLIVELLGRGIRAINTERYRLLGELERKFKGKPVPVEKTMEAFLRPPFDYVEKGDKRDFMKILSMSIHESAPWMHTLCDREWSPLIERFSGALSAALPHLDEELLHWRVHFSIGSMIHIFNLNMLEFTCKEGFDLSLKDKEVVLRELISYSAAGLKSREAR